MVGAICVRAANAFGQAMSKNELRPTEPAFWDERYAAGRIPWDMGGVPERLTRFLTAAEKPGRVLIPGCGSGYEVAAFADAGWAVSAIDFSPLAVERARHLLGPRLGGRVQVGNFFTTEFPPAAFDLVYERTFFCTLSPGPREAYVARMVELLSEGGRLAGFFYAGEERDGPPYQLSAPDERALFTARFELTHEEAMAESMAIFGGHERWREYRRR